MVGTFATELSNAMSRQFNPSMMRSIAGICTIVICSGAILVQAFSPADSNDGFSLSAYQRARALETSNTLDASRFHFQICFVDNDNFHGRIAEGMLARVAEYNDALFTIFPASATIASSPKAPRDAAAPKEAVAICEELGLCSAVCSEMGTSFDMSFLDQYDLIVALDEEIQLLILRSLPAEQGYESKCRLLSEFLSDDFYNINAKNENDASVEKKKTSDSALIDMIQPELWERAGPFYEMAKGSSSSIFASSSTISKDVAEPRMILSETGAAVPNTVGWPFVEAAMLVACAGVTRFCLDTMDSQFDLALQSLLDTFFYREDHLGISVDEADAQLRKGSFSVTGYFSPRQRRERIEQHLADLRSRLGADL